jgi:hypothetical protein
VLFLLRSEEEYLGFAPLWRSFFGSIDRPSAKISVFVHLKEKSAGLAAGDYSVFARDLGPIVGGASVQEAKNWPNIPLQEKFHRGILWGLRNISDTP